MIPFPGHAQAYDVLPEMDPGSCELSRMARRSEGLRPVFARPGASPVCRARHVSDFYPCPPPRFHWLREQGMRQNIPCMGLAPTQPLADPAGSFQSRSFDQQGAEPGVFGVAGDQGNKEAETLACQWAGGVDEPLEREREREIHINYTYIYIYKNM